MTVARAAQVAELEARAARLRRLGDGAVVLDDDGLRRARPARLVRAIRTAPGGLELLDGEGAVIARLPEGARAQLVVADSAVAALSEAILGPQARPLARPPSLAETEARLSRLLSRGGEGLALDLTWEGADDRYRFRAGRFRFVSLGEGVGLSARRNWRLLIDRLNATTGSLRVDLDYGRVGVPTRGLLFVSDATGGAWDHPRSEGESEFELYCRWVQAAGLAGLWSQADFPATPGGPDTGGENPAPPGPPPGWRRIPSSTRTATERALDRVRVWGPPGIVLPLGLVAALSALAPVRVTAPPAAFAAGVCLSLAALALVHATVTFKRRRRIEDRPTSRIRSAALGPVEIVGKTDALFQLSTPFSLVPCVYYEFQVVIESRASLTATGTEGGAALRFLLGRGGSRGGAAEYTGRSGAVPFLVRDETGAIEVRPDGARLDFARTQVLNNPPLAAGMATGGESVVVTERYIPVGYPVHITGELQRRVGDAAQIDGQSDPRVLARPVSGGPFVISERGEEEQISRLERRLGLALLAALALLVGGIAATQRLAGG